MPGGLPWRPGGTRIYHLVGAEWCWSGTERGWSGTEVRSGAEARSAGVERSNSQIRVCGGAAERGISSPGSNHLVARLNPGAAAKTQGYCVLCLFAGYKVVTVGE